jgi:hypothetical protein
MGLNPELEKGRSADKVGLEIQDVVDQGVEGQEFLCRALGFQLLLL